MGYDVASYGSLLGIVGLLLLGLAGTRAPLPSPWRALPLLIALLALSSLYFYFIDQVVLHAPLFGMIWLAAGFFLRRDSRTSGKTVRHGVEGPTT